MPETAKTPTLHSVLRTIGEPGRRFVHPAADMSGDVVVATPFVQLGRDGDVIQHIDAGVNGTAYNLTDKATGQKLGELSLRFDGAMHLHCSANEDSFAIAANLLIALADKLESGECDMLIEEAMTQQLEFPV